MRVSKFLMASLPVVSCNGALDVHTTKFDMDERHSGIRGGVRGEDTADSVTGGGYDLPTMEFTDAYDVRSFGDVGRAAVDALEAYLRSVMQRELPVLEQVAPEALREELLARPFAARPEGAEEAARLIEAVLARSVRVHHPRYVGHQMSAPPPLASVFEMLNAVLNNGMGVYEMGQIQTIMEEQVVGFLAQQLGLGDRAGGVMTHGGSLGNLTALLAARQSQADHDVWTEGQRRPFAVLVSDQTHYCVARAVSIMGWGTEGAVKVRSDARFRLDVADLPRALAQAREAGRDVIGVVASACTTATGSIDPIDAIADFCNENELWLHVDGAHGASLSMSERHRRKLTGIERADSVVQDLHKMMGLPALNTAVLYRDARRAYGAFAQEASYLYRDDAEAEWFNLGHRTLECTKRGMSMTAWCMLRILGTRWFGESVDRLIDLAVVLHALVEESPDFESATPPEANILCFRHRRDGLEGEALDVHQERLREAVNAAGEFYIVQTRLRGAVWLRVAIMNPLTTADDLAALLDALRN